MKPGTCNKFTETHNNSTQTDDSFTEYLKQQTQEKQQEPPKEKPKEKSNPSRPGQTLKPATLEMIRKDEEKKKKEEKDKLKKQQKDERRQQYIKEKAQKDKEEAEKAILAQKNPFSVFKKDDEEDDSKATSKTDIADTLGETFCHNSSSFNYSESFRKIKTEQEKVKLNFKSQNNEIITKILI